MSLSSEPHYALFLDDMSVPGFCSLPKMYIGTKADLLAVAKNMAREGSYPQTSAAIRAYFAGQTDATHCVALGTRPVLEPVTVLASSEMHLPSKTWDHMNTWGYPYTMRFQEANVTQILAQYKDEYYRCIRTSFVDLCYSGTWGNRDWVPVGGLIMGNACVLDLSDKVFRNLLYVVEGAASEPDTLQQVMTDADAIEFSCIMEEIFGDG